MAKSATPIDVDASPRAPRTRKAYEWVIQRVSDVDGTITSQPTPMLDVMNADTLEKYLELEAIPGTFQILQRKSVITIEVENKPVVTVKRA